MTVDVIRPLEAPLAYARGARTTKGCQPRKETGVLMMPPETGPGRDQGA